jgi:hypothetical protein
MNLMMIMIVVIYGCDSRFEDNMVGAAQQGVATVVVIY